MKSHSHRGYYQCSGCRYYWWSLEGGMSVVVFFLPSGPDNPRLASGSTSFLYRGEGCSTSFDLRYPTSCGTALGLLANEGGIRRIGRSERFGGRRGRDDGGTLHVMALPFQAIINLSLSVCVSVCETTTIQRNTDQGNNKEIRKEVPMTIKCVCSNTLPDE